MLLYKKLLLMTFGTSLVFQHSFQLIHYPHHNWHYISVTAFSIWRGFCTSGQKILDPTTYEGLLDAEPKSCSMVTDYKATMLTTQM